MSNLSDYIRFADRIVGSVSCVPGLGNIYWCQVHSKYIRGFRDASGFRPWINILRQKDNTCIVRSCESKPHEFSYSSEFESITREDLTAIATDLFSRIHK